MSAQQGDQAKLLLVDDMQANILMLNELLAEDYHTFFAMDGASALVMAAEKMPDLILLDVQMPDMDGMEVCRRLKADPKTMRIPVIFVTALTEESAESAGLELGAVDFITKPFNPSIVRLRVKNQLVLKKYQDHLEELVQERTIKLQLAKEAAEAGSRAKTKFLVILGHELRTPLNGIMGFSDILIDQLAEDNALECARYILSSAHHLNTIVDNILDLVKLASGGVVLVNKSFNVRELVTWTTHVINEKYGEKGLMFDSDIAADVPESIVGDRQRIGQILDHLLDNAFKFTAKGSVHLGVGHQVDQDGVKQLIFSIRDTGVGIAPEKLEEMFGIFTSEAENPNTQHKGGLGLGLAICQHIIKLMVTIQPTPPPSYDGSGHRSGHFHKIRPFPLEQVSQRLHP